MVKYVTVWFHKFQESVQPSDIAGRPHLGVWGHRTGGGNIHGLVQHSEHQYKSLDSRKVRLHVDPWSPFVSSPAGGPGCKITREEGIQVTYSQVGQT